MAWQRLGKGDGLCKLPFRTAAEHFEKEPDGRPKL